MLEQHCCPCFNAVYPFALLIIVFFSSFFLSLLFLSPFLLQPRLVCVSVWFLSLLFPLELLTC